MSKAFYAPTPEHAERLSTPWCASYSGGKDSTSLVTWIEWLRRSGQVDAPAPRLVQSDTLVEYPQLQALSVEMMALLRGHGWECAVVEPLVHERLYNRILGVGLTPIHPGIRSLRWCTRSTKIAPMDRWRTANGVELVITGVRLGESDIRDGKLKKRGCAAGGECGLPDLNDNTYGPIIRWKTCQVVDWLNGHVGSDVRRLMADVFTLTKRLIDVYDVEVDRDVFEWADPIVTAARFGCIGCPAIQSERHAPRSSTKRHGADSPLNELYDVWFEARRRHNRLWGGRHGKQFGPIRMEVRKRLFDRVMDIQRRAGVVLVRPEDEAFIRECWANKVYPRGWSEEDEAVPPPSETPLMDDAERFARYRAGGAA